MLKMMKYWLGMQWGTQESFIYTTADLLAVIAMLRKSNSLASSNCLSPQY